MLGHSCLSCMLALHVQPLAPLVSSLEAGRAALPQRPADQPLRPAFRQLSPAGREYEISRVSCRSPSALSFRTSTETLWSPPVSGREGGCRPLISALLPTIPGTSPRR
jgi:hypothetical protein